MDTKSSASESMGRWRLALFAAKPIRYIVFSISLALVTMLYLFHASNTTPSLRTSEVELRPSPSSSLAWHWPWAPPSPTPKLSLLPESAETPPEPPKPQGIPVPGLEAQGGFFPTPIKDVDVRLDPPVDPETGRANATLLMLCRNSDLPGAIRSMMSLEKRFNREYGYPWTFLNEEPFTDEFKTRISRMTDAPVYFGVIPPDHWYQPSWINETIAEENRIALSKTPGDWPVPYALSVSYRNMCRFNSGFFFRHELLAKYKWYWRVEPDVNFSCDFYFDPFKFMVEHNKRYSFTIAIKEVAPTIPTLWDHVKEFQAKYPEVQAQDNAMRLMSDNDGADYNLCHFWSNFEIADLDFFRSPHYLAFFDHLDKTGNFYYQRWGDAPVHSIAAALFLPKDQIHFFQTIGYEHPPFQHCPRGPPHRLGKCECKFTNNIDYTASSCLRRFEKLFPRGVAG